MDKFLKELDLVCSLIILSYIAGGVTCFTAVTVIQYESAQLNKTQLNARQGNQNEFIAPHDNYAQHIGRIVVDIIQHICSVISGIIGAVINHN